MKIFKLILKKILEVWVVQIAVFLLGYFIVAFSLLELPSLSIIEWSREGRFFLSLFVVVPILCNIFLSYLNGDFE